MKHSYHILTPFSREANLQRLGVHLRDLGLIWHPIMNETFCFRIEESEWLKPCVCPVPPKGWNPGHHVLNYYLEHEPICEEARYLILCDDDWYEDGFFDKIDAIEGDVLVCSMKRGNTQPPNCPQYGTSTLVASRENLRVGYVAGEQLILRGNILKNIRFGPENDSDGRIIVQVCEAQGQEKVKFVPEACVLFNYLQPGRWT